jgi:Ca2+-binding EF-hand superfamily protein
MAAAVAAWRAGNPPDEHRKQRKEHLEIDPFRDVIKNWDVSRQLVSAIGLQWVRRKLVLTSERLLLCKADQTENVIVDYVPLHEIENITPLSSERGGTPNSKVARSPSVKHILAVDRDPFELQEDDKDPNMVLVVATIPDGHNAGRQAVILFGSRKERDDALPVLKKMVKHALQEQARIANPGRIQQAQRRAVKIYESSPVQTASIGIIIGSFLASLAEAQMPAGDPLMPRHFSTFWWVELFFTAGFFSELCLAIFAFGPRTFFATSVNVFDACIVILCVVSIVLNELPYLASLRMVRVLRLARVLSLIKRIRALNILLVALANSVFPVVLIFLLLALVLAMLALIATELFRELDPDNFGDVERTVFSLYQVASGDSWASAITRGLLGRHPDVPDWLVRTFFVGCHLTIGVVLMNMVVAILLDEFMGTIAKEKADQRRAEMLEKSMSNISIVGHRQQPLDPLMAGLVTFTTENDLLTKIAAIYETMDVDESGSMSREELNAGLKLFSIGGQVQLSAEDWQSFGDCLNNDGEMGPAGFQTMILNQLRMYTNRKLATVMNQSNPGDDEHDGVEDIIILALKMIMNYVHQLQKMVADVHSVVDPEARIEHGERRRTQRSRMEVIMNLKNLPLRRAFAKWIDEVKKLSEGAEVLSEIVKHIDEGHGYIRFEEFASLLAQMSSLKVSDPLAHARRIFRHLDVDGSGTIDKAELHAEIKRIESEMSDRDLMLRRLDLVEAKLDAFKSEVKSTVDVRINERMDALADNLAAKVLGALAGNVPGGGGIAAPVTPINPIMVTTKASGTTDLAHHQESLHNTRRDWSERFHTRRRNITDIRHEIAASMSVPLKESNHAEGSASRNQSNEVAVHMDEVKGLFEENE